MSSKVIILGSTGSIGVSALRVLRNLDGFEVFGLSCNNNLTLFEEQLAEFKPSYAAIASDSNNNTSERIKTLKNQFPETTFFYGNEGILELVRNNSDILISSIVGAAGLRPTLEAIPFIKRLALANKETLVMAGDIVMQRLKEYNVELIPVDSEHSAIFSLLTRIEKSNLEKIILTASGGSLRDKSSEEMKHITPEQALNHPTWSMGNKITIDSATMMNKGLEVIEAHYLFEIPYEKIDVIIHPESIIHSLIETKDGAIYAYMSITDMAHPIMIALKYPEINHTHLSRLDLNKISKLEFRPYDSGRFPALELCRHAGKTGGTMPAVLNAANEIAVHAFLDRKIKYPDIVRIIENSMNSHNNINNPSIEDIYNADKWARKFASEYIK